MILREPTQTINGNVMHVGVEVDHVNFPQERMIDTAALIVKKRSHYVLILNFYFWRDFDLNGVFIRNDELYYDQIAVAGYEEGTYDSAEEAYERVKFLFAYIRF